MSNPNLNNTVVTGVTGLTINGLSTPGLVLTTSAQTLLTVTAAHLNRVKEINFCNVSGSPVTVTWQVVKSGGITVRLGFQVPVGVGAALLVNYQSLNLQDGDVLQALASAGTSVEALVSYDDMV